MPRFALVATLGVALTLAGCSLKQSNTDSGGGAPVAAPTGGAKSSDKKAAEQLGFPNTAKRNNPRVSGSDPAADAAGVASAIFPSSSLEARPPAVVLVDKDDWQGAIAAGGPGGGAPRWGRAPRRAPTGRSAGGAPPAVSSETLDRLKPKGAQLASGAQAIL